MRGTRVHKSIHIKTLNSEFIDTSVFDVLTSCCVMVKICTGAKGPSPCEPAEEEVAHLLP